MTVLDDTMALFLWDKAAHLSPLDRAVVLYAAVAGLTQDAAADAAVDVRDRALIAARIARFGAEAEFIATCPHCGEQQDSALNLTDVLHNVAHNDAPAPVLQWRGQSLSLSAPSSRAVAQAARGDTAALPLACLPPHACLPHADLSDQEKRAPTAELMTAMEEALERAYPLLAIWLSLSCVECGGGFRTRFDPAAYLWTDVEAAAARALDGIHLLARAYGWAEDAILAMSTHRRGAYLTRAYPAQPSGIWA